MIWWVGAIICKLRHGQHDPVRSLRQIICGRCGHVLTSDDIKEKRR